MANLEPVELAIVRREKDRLVVMELAGNLDVSTAGKLREALLQLDLDGGLSVHMDLSRLAFLDSSGMGVLVYACRRLRASSGSFSTACSNDAFRALQIGGLVEYLDVSAADQALTRRGGPVRG